MRWARAAVSPRAPPSGGYGCLSHPRGMLGASPGALTTPSRRMTAASFPLPTARAQQALKVVAQSVLAGIARREGRAPGPRSG
eukprot:scaffold87586_cov32-Tisochrysis_lutea.AAC.4